MYQSPGLPGTGRVKTPTNGSSGSSLGCGTSSTLAFLPVPYLMRLLEARLESENLLVDVVGGLEDVIEGLA